MPHLARQHSRMRPTRRDTPFREAMRSLLVFDGAMGSLLYERGIFVMQNFEQLNVTRPDVVAKIHEDYVNAGANIIETNTFGANSFRLDRHGLGDQVRAFNLAAARHGAPDTSIIATMAFDPSETVADGSGPEHVATTLRDWGADGLGVNCGDGPQIALAIAERMRVVDLPLCVQPNAGLPRTVDG